MPFRFSCGLVAAAFEEVADELMTTRGQNRFRVELHTFNIELAMSKAHHQTVLRLRGDLETLGNAVALHNE